MKLLFWRRAKPNTETLTNAPATSKAARSTREKHAPKVDLNETMAFARGYLQAQGAQVTAESPSKIAAHLPDGSLLRYTTSSAEAQEDAALQVLSPGAAALAAIFDDLTARSQIVSLRLPPAEKVDEAVRRLFAPPAKGCGRCLEASVESFDACDTCPLREGKHVLGGLERITATRTIREWDDVSVELAFAVTARDHYGRVDDLVRVAYDASGGEANIVPDEALARAVEHSEPEDAAKRVSAAIALAQPKVEQQAQAIASLLRARGSADYTRRRDEITGAFTAMQAEPDADRATIARALKIEQERLSEVYGADVEAQLQSVVFIHSAMAEVEVTDHARQTFTATIDLGRGLVRDTTWSGPQRGPEPVAVRTTKAPKAGREDSPLTIEALNLLPPAVFAECIRWLLERNGAAVETKNELGASLRFQGLLDGRSFEALAMRPRTGWALSASDARQAASLVNDKREVACLLIGTGPATEPAQAEAQRLGVEIWDRATLTMLLSDQAQAYDRQSQQRTADVEARVAIAAQVRARALAAIEAMEASLAETRGGEKLRTQSQVTSAAASVEQGHGTTLRSLLACETLITDLRSAFAERPARDGSLEIVAPAATLTELLERMAHLEPVAIAAVREVAEQPASGDFGYTAWRKVIVEELTARCETVRWRATALDPMKWRDFGKALDAHAATQAETSLAAAERAGARAAHLALELGSRSVPSR